MICILELIYTWLPNTEGTTIKQLNFQNEINLIKLMKLTGWMKIKQQQKIYFFLYISDCIEVSNAKLWKFTLNVSLRLFRYAGRRIRLKLRSNIFIYIPIFGVRFAKVQTLLLEYVMVCTARLLQYFNWNTIKDIRVNFNSMRNVNGDNYLLLLLPRIHIICVFVFRVRKKLWVPMMMQSHVCIRHIRTARMFIFLLRQIRSIDKQQNNFLVWLSFGTAAVQKRQHQFN